MAVERHGSNDDRVVDLSGMPEPVVRAVAALASQSRQTSLAELSRDRLGDLVQAAETVKSFADASSLEATSALVADVVADHGVARDDPRFAAKVAVHRRQACRAVVHEVQLLTGSTLTAARDRVRFATALRERVGGARLLLRTGACSWERARLAYAETAHLDPVLAGSVIERLLAAPERTTCEDGDSPGIPLSHAGFRARVRRQLALVTSADAERARRHQDAVARRDTWVFAAHDGAAELQISGDAVRIFTAQQRVAELAKAARSAGDRRTAAQLRADIATDLLMRGTVPGDDLLGNAPAGRLQVIVDLGAILPDRVMCRAPGAACGVGEAPGLGFLTADQVRELALQAGSTWSRLVTDPVTGVVIDAASTYRAPRAMSRLVRARDHTCRAPGDCGVPADQSDLDHDTEHVPGVADARDGATHPDNLHALHRGHHNAKTGSFWSSRQHRDASITWHTLTRRLRTTAFDHRRPEDRLAPVISPVERKLGVRLAAYGEHDLTPSVFTDLDDLRLCTDDIPRDGPTPTHRIRLQRPREPILVDLPDPPPPF